MEINSLSDLFVYPNIKRSWNANAFNIPVTHFELNPEGASTFNKVLKFVLSLDLPVIIRTPSGGISNYRIDNKYNCYDYRYSNYCAEITLLTLKGCWRFQCRTAVPKVEETAKPLYGSSCLSKFKQLCLKFNIDLDDYAVDNGLEIKKEWKSSNTAIYKKFIYGSALNLVDKTLFNVHHIDLCSGFQSGLARAFPEFREVCQYLYDKRKEDSSIKLIQNASIGAMWSDQRHAKYIKLAKSAIEENNKFLDNIIQKLLDSGREPLLLNTDGVWYRGEVYHDETEFANLGGWRNDHINCTFRMKNNTTYEYIENGKFTVVMSGATSLDKVKPREKWMWGDIYRTEPIAYFIDENGIKSPEGEYY